MGAYTKRGRPRGADDRAATIACRHGIVNDSALLRRARGALGGLRIIEAMRDLANGVHTIRAPSARERVSIARGVPTKSPRLRLGL